MYDEVVKHSKDSFKLESLRQEVTTSCKNVMRQFSLNPAIATALRNELIHESTKRYISETDAKIVEGLKGRPTFSLDTGLIVDRVYNNI